MAAFISGRELCREFYLEAVEPLLAAEYPDLPHAAALIGPGSEVLGFDDETSTDHDWSARVMLFLRDDEDARLAGKLADDLARLLPRAFRGVPTADIANLPHDRGCLQTVRGFFTAYLGYDPDEALTPADWLTFPTQKLRTLTDAAIYRDDVGLRQTLDRFACYPHDVWLYLLAAGWNRIGQEEHLMGRAGSVGDEIGSAIIGARLVRDLMRLCFLIERTYAPYPKWFGTAFRGLACAETLEHIFRQALAATIWQQREDALCAAYEHVARMQNALGITEPRPTECAPFFDRPFRVIHLHAGFADAIRATITDPEVRRIAEHPLIGSIDQWSDSADVLSDSRWRDRLKALYL